MTASYLFLNDAGLAGEDGWAVVAPFGDFPGTAVVTQPDGQISRVPAIQRLDRAAAQKMVESFNSLTGKTKRFFRGVPIYNGHPDVPGMKDQYPDAESKGVIKSLRITDRGLEIQPLFNDQGARLLESDIKLFFSGRWEAEPAGEESGKVILRPSRLKSAGLTPHPNLPTELLNDQPACAGPGRDSHAGQAPPPIMEKAKLIAALNAAGFALANDATDDAITQTIKDLGTKAASVVTLANDKAAQATEITTLKTKVTAQTTEIANERTARITDLLDHAQTAGRITEAERTVWKGRLEVQFANEREALLRLPVKIKTEPATDGARRTSATDAKSASTSITEIANAFYREEAAPGGSDSQAWQRAYNRACRENPALVELMNRAQA